MIIELGWPEWIAIIWAAFNSAIMIARANGFQLQQVGPVLMTAKAFYLPALWGALLYWGGFFS